MRTPQLKALGGVLGLPQCDPQAFLQGGPGASISDDEVNAKIQARLAARKQKHYAEADRIRAELAAAGIVLEDGAQGTTWRRS